MNIIVIRKIKLTVYFEEKVDGHMWYVVLKHGLVQWLAFDTSQRNIDGLGLIILSDTKSRGVNGLDGRGIYDVERLLGEMNCLAYYPGKMFYVNHNDQYENRPNS